MPRSVRVMRIDPIKCHYTPMLLSGGNSMVRAVQRVLHAQQLGWKELCQIEDTRLMGFRPKQDGPGQETYDAGPTPLVVAADNQADAGTPGFRLLGIKDSTAGISILFGKGAGGGMIDCPVDVTWLDRHLVWLTGEEADADEPSCKNHPDRSVRDTLDGDPLCQECCDDWVRGQRQDPLDVN